MVTWWLILIAIILILLILALSVYTVYYFGSDADDVVSFVVKGIAVLGIALIMVVVLLLPYDVACRQNYTEYQKHSLNINTQAMWEAILWITCIFAIIILPFAMFYYDAEDPDGNTGTQICTATVYSLIGATFFFVLAVILWTTVGVASIKYYDYEESAMDGNYSDPTAFEYQTRDRRLVLKISVSFFVYVVAMMATVGWAVFILYAGVGLVALPVGLIWGFFNRPKPLSATVFATAMDTLAEKAKALIMLGEEVRYQTRGGATNSQKTKVKIIERETYILEEEQDLLIWAYEKAGGSPFFTYGSLLFGVIGVGLSILWVLQIFLYNVTKATPLLNTMLIAMDNVFSFFAILFYGIFAFYLLAATFNGQVSLGVRLLFFRIHPMKRHDTLMSSLLFNIIILLLGSVALVQFCAQSFADYAANTSAFALLNVYVLNLRGIGDFIQWAPVILCGMLVVTALWMLICPKSKKRRDIFQRYTEHKYRVVA